MDGVRTQQKLFRLVMMAAALAVIVPLTISACGSSSTSASGGNTKVAPSAFDAPLGSDAVLINGTGFNPTAPSAASPVAGGCVSRWINVRGNDINCSSHAKYASSQSCQLNPYEGYANFLVVNCPTTNLIGRCVFSTHTMYYYQGYLIVSPVTTVSVLSAGCSADGGSWL